jgi:hypothetical protein
MFGIGIANRLPGLAAFCQGSRSSLPISIYLMKMKYQSGLSAPSVGEILTNGQHFPRSTRRGSRNDVKRIKLRNRHDQAQFPQKKDDKNP